MTALKIAVGSLFFLGAAILLSVQHRSITSLKMENSSLRDVNRQIDWLQTENQRLSNSVKQATASHSDEYLELLRLRGEVGQLRSETDRLRAQDRQRRAEVVATTLSASDHQPSWAYISKEDWAFVGYGTPETALQSVLWASSNGDVRAFLTSVTPDMLERLQESGLGTDQLATALAEESDKIKGYQIKSAENPAHDKMVLDVAFGDDVRKVKLEIFQGRWLLAEPIGHSP